VFTRTTIALASRGFCDILAIHVAIVRKACREGRLGGGKALGVLLKTLAAEEFGSNRFFELRQGPGPCTDFAEQVLKREKYL